MSLIVEDGTGVTGAVSYVDEAGALALLTARGLVTDAYTALGTAGQAQAILRGADLLNDQRRHPWKGAITVPGRQMMWPRDGIVFPAVMALCNALYAIDLANGVAYADPSSPLGSITSVDIGPISVAFDPKGTAAESDPSSYALVRNPTIDGLLFPYVLLPRDAILGGGGGVAFYPLVDILPAYSV